MTSKTKSNQINLVTSEGEYEVQQILNRKNTKDGLKYLVKWKGFDLDQSTWQPLNNLYHSMEFVKSYQKKLSQAKKTHPIEKKDIQNDNDNDKDKDKEQIFKQHLIFPEPTSIKAQNKNQLVNQNQKRVNKKIKKKKNIKSKKCLKFNEKETKGSDFCILIDQDQSVQIQIKNQRHIQEQKQFMQNIQQNLIDDNLLSLNQSQFQDFNRKIEEDRNLLNQIEEQCQVEDFIPSLSLNLTQLEQEQGNKLILQNLNPDFKQEQFIDFNQFQKRKLCRLKSSQNIRILQPKNPILKNKQIHISKIVKYNEKWFAQVKLKDKTQGFAQIQTLKRYNIVKVLDYLMELMPK